MCYNEGKVIKWVIKCDHLTVVGIRITVLREKVKSAVINWDFVSSSVQFVDKNIKSLF